MSETKVGNVEKIIQCFTSKGGYGINNETNRTLSCVELDDIDNKTLLKENVKLILDSDSSILFPYIRALFIGTNGNTKESLRRLGKLFNTSVDLMKLGKFSKQENNEILELLLSTTRMLNRKQTEAGIVTILREFSLDPLNEESINGHNSALELIPQLVSRNGEKVCREYALDTIYEMSFPRSSIVALSATLVNLCECESDLRKAIEKIKSYIVLDTACLVGNSAVLGNINSVVVVPEDLPALIYQLTCLSRKFETSSDNSLISLSKKLVFEAVSNVLDSLVHATKNGIEACRLSDAAEAISGRLFDIMSTIVHHLSLLVSKDQGISSEIVKLVKSRGIFVPCRVDSFICTALSLSTAPSKAYNAPSTQAPLHPISMNRDEHFPSCPIIGDNSAFMSTSRLLLALLAAKAPRLEDGIVQNICESIQEVYSARSLHVQSQWFPPHDWVEVCQTGVLSSTNLQRLFADIFNGPLMVESIVQPIMKCATALLLSPGSVFTFGTSFSTALKSLSSLSTSNLTISPLPIASLSSIISSTDINSKSSCASSPQGLGAWLLVQLFICCPHARFPVIREIVQHLQTAIYSADATSGHSLQSHLAGGITTQVVSTSVVSPFRDQSLIEKLLLGVLAHLTSSSLFSEVIMMSSQQIDSLHYRQGNSGILQELMELFFSLPSFLPRTAGELVRVVLPILCVSPGLADRCTLSLRKASFSKDMRSRLAAVSALMTLLRVQHEPKLGNAGLVSNESYDRESHYSRKPPASELLSTEEILSLCRRFLHHQAPVRSLLYNKLLCLHSDVLSLRSLSVRLTRTHLLTLLLDNEDSPSRSNAGHWQKEIRDILSVESRRYMLHLNLDSCVDQNADSQEALCDLLVTLATMVKKSSGALASLWENVDAALESHDKCGGLDGSRDVEAPCTQYGYCSQIDAFQSSISSSSQNNIARNSRHSSRARRKLHDFAQEVDDAFTVLWRLCCGLAHDKPHDYSLPVHPSTRNEYNKYTLIVEALQAALCCVATLPNWPRDRSYAKRNTHDENLNDEFDYHMQSEKVYVMQHLSATQRLALFCKLAQQLETYSAILLMYRKQEKEGEKKRNKKGHHDDLTRREDAPTAASLSFPKNLGAYQSLEGLNMHWMESELGMCIFCLDELFVSQTLNGDDDDDDVDGDSGSEIPIHADEVAVRDALRGSSCCQFLRKHVLERSLYCLEILLKHLAQSPTQQHNIEKLSNVDCISSQCYLLFQCLMRVLITFRTEDKAQACEMGTQNYNHLHTFNNSNSSTTLSVRTQGEGRGRHSFSATPGQETQVAPSTALGSVIYPSASHHQSLYPNQLVLRCMLGCLRIENVIGTRLGTSCSDTNENDKSIAGLLRMERMVTLLEEGFRVGHSGRLQGRTKNRPDCIDDYSNMSDLTESFSNIDSRLEKQAKKFLELFLMMCTPDGAERNESPAVILLLSEVCEALTPARRLKFQEIVLCECRDRLSIPTTAVTTSLLQLLIYVMPADSKSRIEITRRLCLLIADCCTTEQNLQNDEDDENYDMEEVEMVTYTIVSKKTAASAIITVVGMLDKMCSEIDCLMRISIRTAKAIKATNTCSFASTSATSRDATVAALWGGDDLSPSCTNPDVSRDKDMKILRVNDEICKAIKTCMEMAAHFLSFKSPGVVSHCILALFMKLIKLQVKMAKINGSKPAAERALVVTSPLFQSFREMSLSMATTISQNLNRYVTEVHNVLDGLERSVAKASSGKTVYNKLSRLIPDLMFQMEEIDLNVIKLMSGLKDRDKHTASKWLCKVAARDFRLSERTICQDQHKLQSGAVAGKRKSTGGQTHRRSQDQSNVEGVTHDDNEENFNKRVRSYDH